jgi:hypothetical protein
MHDNQPGAWLARDGDGRILEVDADDHPGAEAAEHGYWPAQVGGLLVGPPRTGKSGWPARQPEAEAG